MSIPRHIKEYLDSTHVSYRHSIHSPAFTAQEIAHVQHVSGKQLAKTVMVLADKKLVACIVDDLHDFIHIGIYHPLLSLARALSPLALVPM